MIFRLSFMHYMLLQFNEINKCPCSFFFKLAIFNNKTSIKNYLPFFKICFHNSLYNSITIIFKADLIFF
jgi:hypothetical protein